MRSIPETVSENRRGRPPVFDRDLIATYRAIGLFTEAHTSRAQADACYRQQAVAALADISGVDWILDRTKVAAGEPKAWRPTVLAELGRWGEPDVIRTMAKALVKRVKAGLCSTSREAVAVLRDARLGRLA